MFLTAFSGIFRRKARVTRPAWWLPPSLDCFEANCGGLCRKGGSSYSGILGLSEYMVVLVFTAVLSELWHFLSSRPESYKKSWKKYFTFFCRPSRRRPFSPLFIIIIKNIHRRHFRKLFISERRFPGKLFGALWRYLFWSVFIKSKISFLYFSVVTR